MLKKKGLHFFEFDMNVESLNEEKREFTARLTPKADRYEEFERNGERYLRDRKTGAVYKYRTFIEHAIKQSSGMPIFSDRPPDVLPFLEHRVVALCDALINGSLLKQQNHVQQICEQWRSKLKPGKHRVIVACVDTVCSTELSLQLHRKKFRTLMELAIHEIYDWALLFGGIPLKGTGDGAYILFPARDGSYLHGSEGAYNSAARACDFAAHLRMVFFRFWPAIMPVYGYPAPAMRVGLDFGEVEVSRVEGSQQVVVEAYGNTMNLASKIQGLGEPWEVLVGEDVFRMLPGFCAKFCEARDPLPYPRPGGEEYRLYRMNKDVVVDVEAFFELLKQPPSEGHDITDATTATPYEKTTL